MRRAATRFARRLGVVSSAVIAAVVSWAASGSLAHAQYVGTTPKGKVLLAATACSGGATYCGPTVLDPNGDGYVSTSSSGFTLSSSYVGPCSTGSLNFPYGNDRTGSEIAYVPNPQIVREPLADLDTGSTGGATELVDSPLFQSSFVYYDKGPDNTRDTADDRLLFRLRVGSNPSGAFGYSVLIDSDQRFGCATAGVGGCVSSQVTTQPDSNYVTGNPGFEAEVILATGGSKKGINIVNVDGTTSGTIIKSYAYDTNHQRALASTEVSCDDDVFMDFYVNFTDLAPLGITSSTPLRFIAATSSSPASALGGSASDIGGVNDSDPAFADDDSAFTFATANVPTTTFGTLGSGGGFGPTVSFSSASVSASEGAGSVAITVALSTTSTLPVTVPVTVSGTATSPADYSLSATSVTIPAGSSSATLTVTLVDDSAEESNETVVLALGTPTNATVGTTGTSTLTITDNDRSVTWNASSASLAEGGGSLTLTAQLSSVSSSTVTVPFTVTGTATVGADATVTASPLVIAAGSTTATLTITVIDDTLDEADETVVVTMGTPTGASKGATTVYTATITDNDPAPVVNVATGSVSQSVAEGAGTATIAVQLSTASGQDVVVPFTLAGSATSVADYAIGGSSVTIPAGSTSASVLVTLIDDALDEPNETVVLTLGTPSQATLGSSGTATLTLTDDDPAPAVSFATASQSTSEGAGTVTLTVQLSAVSALPVDVGLVYGGTASSPADYSGPSSVSIPAGSTSATVSLTLVDDAIVEGNETVTLALAAPSNATLGGTSSTTLTLADNDGSLSVFLANASTTVHEGDGTVTLSVQLSGTGAQSVTVPFTVSGTASVLGDYVVSASPLVIPAGQTSGTISLTLIDDTLNESDETVTLTLGTPTNAVLGSTTAEIVTIQDDDGAPSATFAAATQTVNEAAGSLTVTVTLSNASGQDVSVPFTTGGTAVSPADYLAPASPLVIPAGELSGTLTLVLVNDTAIEGDESVVITMGSPTHASKGAITTDTITLTDDEGPPTVNLAEASQSVRESNGTVVVTFSLSAPSGLPVTVPFIVSGTATTGVDYTAPASPITFAPGETSATAVITLLDDSLIEGDETLVVSMGVPTNADKGSNTSETITLTDDESPPTVSFALGSVTTAENGGTATLTINLSLASTQDVVVPFSVGGSATRPADFAITASPVVIPAGSTSTTLTVTLVDDAIAEGDETVVVTLGSPTHASVGATGEATLTITDDEGPPSVNVATATQVVGEAGGDVDVVLQLSSASAQDVTVPFSVAGTATVNQDYTVPSTSAVIQAGATQAHVTFTVLDDARIEGPESIVLTLGVPSNATRGANAVTTIDIVDDELPPTVVFASSTLTANEGSGQAQVTVNLSAPSTLPVTVPLLFGGTAASPADYVPTPTSITFAPGATSAALTLAIVDDSALEGEESVVVALGVPTNATLGVPATFTLRITDNESGDSDGDGLSDATEATLGTDPLDADSDDDGIPDGQELALDQDTDGDHLINALDPDSDGDGLFDGTEHGVTNPPAATDLTKGHFVADADPTTKTDPLLVDTDGGGVSDGLEDANHNGRIDQGERDPNDGRDDDPSADADGDGIPNGVEGRGDSDHDGIPNYLDLDSDGDFIADRDEAGDADLATPPVDTDHDKIPDYLDLDTDDDGLSDALEAGDQDLATPPVDSDRDGTPDYRQPRQTDAGVGDAGGSADGGAEAGADAAGDTDARETDAGAADAGAVDAGAIDAGVVDALEAGAPEASAPEQPPELAQEAGVPDAGPIDADVVDTKPADANAPETGLPDATADVTPPLDTAVAEAGADAEPEPDASQATTRDRLRLQGGGCACGLAGSNADLGAMTPLLLALGAWVARRRRHRR